MSKRTILPSAIVVGALAASPCFAAEGWQPVEEALGVSGSIQPGDVYKVSLPRTDLNVTADGVAVEPALALGSWLAFKRTDGGTTVMGDLVLTEDAGLFSAGG